MLDLQLLAQTAAVAPDPKLIAHGLFLLMVVAFLALDLGVFHRDAHEVSMKEALTWSVIWVTLGLAFSLVVYAAYEGQWFSLGANTALYNPAANTDPAAPLLITGTVSGFEAAKQYLTGYVVEKSLAMDNIFVIAILFGYFAVPAKYQHRVLFWGILGALVMRGAMIAVGGSLILQYQWVLIIFGLFLLLTAVKMVFAGEEKDPTNNPVVRLMKRIFPVTEFYDGQRFITKRTLAPTYSRDPNTGKEVQDPPPAGTLRARWAITPLLLVLVLVEITDLVFAVDSIPAIFAITPDPFIVFTSNVFAILGLRSLYFCLAALISKFRFLKPALILILAFVGVKLLLLSVPPYLDDMGAIFGVALEAGSAIKVSTTLSLSVVLGLLASAVIASILAPSPKEAKSS
ncbi:MAG: TerC/Alx family metal homeostasis membrane protein [Polyangiaceae bacterium]|nr:TerC/Alx family metal homeostasis membrane protein [Polyangiaceae bacterium]